MSTALTGASMELQWHLSPFITYHHIMTILIIHISVSPILVTLRHSYPCVKNKADSLAKNLPESLEQKRGRMRNVTLTVFFPFLWMPLQGGIRHQKPGLAWCYNSATCSLFSLYNLYTWKHNHWKGIKWCSKKFRIN